MGEKPLERRTLNPAIFRNSDDGFINIFQRYQKELLWLANHWFSKWLLGLNRLPKPIKLELTKIERICPNSIHWKTGRMFKKNGQWHEEWKMAAFSPPRFAEALVRNLGWLFQLFHYWDIQIANRLHPAWNLGFDSQNFYTGAGDGLVGVGDSLSWDQAHHATAGTFAYHTYAYAECGIFYYNGWSFRRGFYPINTSNLPDNADITAASFFAVPMEKFNNYNDGKDYIVLVQTSQASPTSLVVEDYDQCGAVHNPTLGSATYDITNITVGQYLAMVLNATGRSWISKTGWTLLGYREGHDIEDIPPSNPSNYNHSSVALWASEKEGTSQDPYLSVTYTVPTLISVSDSGSGADAIAAIKALLQLTDSGGSTDAISLKYKLTLSDLGLGSDIISILRRIAASDSGLGAEALSILARISVLESGAGAETLGILGKLAIADSGLGSDVVSVLVKFTIIDSGQGTDTVSAKVFISVSDAGVGSDAAPVMIEVPISVADTGAGSEIVSILNKLLVSDSGLGTDLATILVKLSTSDSGIGIDAVSNEVKLTISDSGAGLELLSILAKILLQDSAVGAEVISILAKLSVLDSGSGLDVAAIKGIILLYDSGVGNESLAIKSILKILESAVGSDVISINYVVQTLIQDSGLGADFIAAIKALLTLTDTGSGIDAVAVKNFAKVIDSGVASEVIGVIGILIKLKIIDAGIGAERVKARWTQWLKQTYQKKTSSYSSKTNPYIEKIKPYKIN